MEKVIRFTLPIIFELYLNHENSIKIRKNCISILFSIINWIFNHKTVLNNKNELIEFLLNYLPKFIEAFSQDLLLGNAGDLLSIKISIYQVLCLLVYSMDKTLSQFNVLSTLLVNSFKLLFNLQDLFYFQLIVTKNQNQNEFDFNSGVFYNLENLILLILEFFQSLISKNLETQFFIDSIEEISFLLIFFMQLTSEQLENVEFDSCEFIKQENKKFVFYSSTTIRHSSNELIKQLLRNYHRQFPVIIDKILNSFVSRLNATPNSTTTPSGTQIPPELHWRLKEPVLFAFSENFRIFLKYSDSFLLNFSDFLKNLSTFLFDANIMLRLRALLTFSHSLLPLSKLDRTVNQSRFNLDSFIPSFPPFFS